MSNKTPKKTPKNKKTHYPLVFLFYLNHVFFPTLYKQPSHDEIAAYKLSKDLLIYIFYVHPEIRLEALADGPLEGRRQRLNGRLLALQEGIRGFGLLVLQFKSEKI